TNYGWNYGCKGRHMGCMGRRMGHMGRRRMGRMDDGRMGRMGHMDGQLAYRRMGRRYMGRRHMGRRRPSRMLSEELAYRRRCMGRRIRVRALYHGIADGRRMVRMGRRMGHMDGRMGRQYMGCMGRMGHMVVWDDGIWDDDIWDNDDIWDIWNLPIDDVWDIWDDVWDMGRMGRMGLMGYVWKLLIVGHMGRMGRHVDLTTNGKAMIRNFLFDISGCTGNYTLQGREVECLKYVKETVGSNKVLLLVSGGVDSTVCAALLHKALREDQVIAVHIDNGFMRKNESQRVEQSLEKLGLRLRVINAAHQFLHGTTTIPMDKREQNSRTRVTKMLCMTANPEEKRKIIGDVFVKIANEVISELNLKPEEVFLGQGTLRPDLIESASHVASNKADVIKTHHNDSELIRQLRDEGRVVEPLKDFHKDEVRMLGRDLGLPPDLVMRHPFPGPGLAIRVLCAEDAYMERDFSETQVLVKIIAEYDQMLQKKHALLNRVESVTSEEERLELRKASNKQHLAATLLPIRSVGVQGDCRSYSYVVGLSSEKEPDWEDMQFLARLIPRVCHNVNRVCYIWGGLVRDQVLDITPTFLTSNVLSTLRQADHVSNQVLSSSGYVNAVSQMPVVMIPVHFDRDQVSRVPSCQRSVVLRPFCTHDFMTGVPAIPGRELPVDVVQRMVTEILTVPGISRVLYDLTSKPPGTTEWE
ncbi:hypothetical protein L9F63_018615, partial [Diploptera punctata]